MHNVALRSASPACSFEEQCVHAPGQYLTCCAVHAHCKKLSVYAVSNEAVNLGLAAYLQAIGDRDSLSNTKPALGLTQHAIASSS